jgi:hypothetical protein
MDEKTLQLVQSFGEVYDAGDVPLNLQSFHRAIDPTRRNTEGTDGDGGNGEGEGGSGAGAAEPDTPLPVLPDLFQWPLPAFFGGDEHPDDSVAVVVDSATEMSRRGAISWWRLDDCGAW